MKLLAAILLIAWQAEFDVASVKQSQTQKGVDYRGHVVIAEDRVTGRNVTLKGLIAAAYHVQHHQVSGGARWLDSDEFDVEAKGTGQMRPMLQALLKQRFHLTLRKEERDLKVQALVIDKGGPTFDKAKAGGQHFHVDMRQFADLLAIQATIPAPADPTSPAIASNAPVPVIDKTGLEGVFDFSVDLKPELSTDRFTQWQRALKEQLGLKLESQKAKVEILVVTSADRVPAAN